jgi:penicillin-binding protein 2
VPKLDTPRAVAGEYLRRWADGDYAGMFQLVIPNTPGVADQDQFVRRYENIAHEATITQVVATLESNQRPDANLQRSVVSIITELVGTIVQRPTLTLVPKPDGWRIQWLPSLMFQELSGDHLVHMFVLTPTRGEILDTTGTALASETNAVSVDVISGKIQDEQQLATALASLFKVSPDAIRGHFREAPADSPVRIRLLSENDAKAMRPALEALPGLVLNDVRVRAYPQGSVAATTLGYLGEAVQADMDRLRRAGYQVGDLVGRAGVERWGEPYLAGGRGGKLAVTTRDFTEVSTIALRPARAADHVKLTLNRSMQATCESALGSTLGAVVVQRVATGELLAVASQPGFDPNVFVLGMTQEQWFGLQHDSKQPLLNRATNRAYPLGPVAHLVAFATALESSIIASDGTLTCTGVWRDKGGGSPIQCWKPGGHGTLTYVQALAQSCDVAACELGRLLNEHDRSSLPLALRGFGLGRATGIVGPDEVLGAIPDASWKRSQEPSGWSALDAAQLAAGRLPATATPLQLATLMGWVAAGGAWRSPYLVAQASGPDGSVHYAPASEHEVAPSITGPTLAVIRQALATGLPSSPAAVKTTQRPLAGLTGSGIDIEGSPLGTWFVGYAPPTQPEIALAIFLEGKTLHNGALAALVNKVLS